MISMRRRDWIALLGGAAAPLLLGPPQLAAQSATPDIGFLSSLSQVQTEVLLAAWRRGLRESGYVEGRNVTVEYLFADGDYGRLPALAGELVRRPVRLIAASGPPAALAAKTTTTTIPIVFVVGFDPAAAGLVQSFNRPGGNATGMTMITGPLGQKRVELVRELAPRAKAIHLLINPRSPDAVPETEDVRAAAQANGLDLVLVNASTPPDLVTAFAGLGQQRVDALIVGSDPFFWNARDQLVGLAAGLRTVTVYPFREFVAAGGLVSYGTNIPNAYRQAGIYVGRILKGDKPADLPVMQPTAFELVINIKTAGALGIDIPATLHARSDEVIE
jgi:putative tryptophan/tyrosine transport system substrate-binding protein